MLFPQHFSSGAMKFNLFFFFYRSVGGIINMEWDSPLGSWLVRPSGCRTNYHTFPLFQIMAGAEEAKFTGMAKYFNSYTMTGRANVSTRRHHGHTRLNGNAP